MHKISRIYVGNYGHQSSWYDGLLLDLLDKSTGEPGDFVLLLANGGGKSTLLSAIFSCFETSQQRFLKHLQKSTNRFSEYFAPDGTPAFILVEWLLPGTRQEQHRRVVTGQVVALKSRITSEMDRYFFSFEATSEVKLDSVPAPRLNEEAAKNLDDCLRWFSRMRRDHKGNFYDTTNQAAWERHLKDERGIDVEMLKVQLEFSRSEGNIEDVFLNFRNEGEFLQKIFRMTMDSEQAQRVRATVLEACDKLKRRPEYQTRLNVLQALSVRLSTFKDSVQRFRLSKDEYLKSELEKSAVVTVLSERASALQMQAQECKVNSEKISSTIIALKKDLADLADKNRALQFLNLERIAESTLTQFTERKRRLDAVRQSLKNVSAAKCYSQILALKAQLDDTRAMAALAQEGLKPFTAHARIQGKILKVLLEKHKGDTEVLRQKSIELSTQKLKERDQLKAAASVLLVELKKVESSLTEFIAERTTYKKRLAYWHERKILERPEDTLQSGVNRLTAEIASLEAIRRDAEADELRLEDFYHQIVSELFKAREELSNKTESCNSLGKTIADAEVMRDEVSQHAALCRAAESQIVDPDNESLLGIVDKYIVELQRMRDASAVTLATLNGDRSEIVSTGLASCNPDVQKVLSALSEGGARTSSSFASYIARTEPDVEHARKIVLSNPARFLGVAVKTEAELALSRTILQNPPALSKPVVVSLTTSEPEHEVQGFVVRAESDAAYNFHSASEYAARLDESLKKQNSLNSEFESMHVLAIEGRQRLLQYREEFGADRLSLLRSELQVLENEMGSLNTFIKEKQEELSGGEAKKESAKQRAKEASAAISNHVQPLRLLERDCDELEKPEVERNRKIAELDLKTRELREECDESQEKSTRAYEESLRANSAAEDYFRQLGSLQAEFMEIRHYDEEFDAAASLVSNPLPLQAARESYRTAANTLSYQEANQLGVLNKELERLDDIIREKEGTYGEEFSSVDQEILRQLIDLDLVSESLRLKTEETTADAEFEQAKSLKIVAENDFNNYKRQNQDTESKARAFNDLDSDLISQELLSIPTHIEVCSTEIHENQSRLNLLLDESKSKTNLSALLDSTAVQLRAAIENYEDVKYDDALLPQDFSEIKSRVAGLIKEGTTARKRKEDAEDAAETQFQNVQKLLFEEELKKVEPDFSMYMNNHTFQTASTQIEEIYDGVIDRIATAQNWLNSVKSDYDATVRELLNLVNSGIRILNIACAKRIPDSAPYLGGKPVLKMKLELNTISPEHRKVSLESFVDELITSGKPHASGTDMVADAIQKIAGRQLGLRIAKLVIDEAQQYAPIEKISNSGGEGVSMALCLYILTAQIRSENLADLKKQPGGPLILDNPFARANSSFIWKAQRAFANAMGVQMIFASPTKDLGTLGEFENFIFLRKSGVNAKTGRQHIEQVDMSLVKV